MKPFRVVAIDESDAWEPTFLAQCGGRVWTLYLLDPGERVHCCELTPSYWLEAIEHVPAVYPESDEERDAMDETLREYVYDSAGYFHCHRIDALPPDRVVTIEAESIDDAREYLQGNPRHPAAVC